MLYLVYAGDADYISLSSVIVIQPIESRRCITVLINDDEILESAESFEVSLSSEVDGLVLIPQIATVTLSDNDRMF